MSFFEKQWKLILGVVGVAILIGAGIAIGSMVSTNNEEKAQAKFFLIEKKYTDYKTKKNQPPVDPKAEKPAVAPATPESLAADMVVIKKDLEQFISDNSKSKATQMAALYYSEILRDEKNNALALTTLEKVQSNDSGLVNTLVRQQMGQLLADSNRCQDAINIWEKIVGNKSAAFMHNEVRIQQALCYQKLNDLKKAEELLTNIANQKSDGQSESATSTKEAAKYLRLIQFKKVSGT